MKPGRITPTRAVLFIFLFAWLALFFSLRLWNKRPVIKDDVIGYYSYLPAVFIYGDITMDYASGNPFFETRQYGTTAYQKGYVQKYTMGMAVIYSPFFFTGHILASLTGYPADGYSTPYQMMLLLSGLVYGWLGLLVLRKLLRRYNTEGVSAAVMLVVGAGTNLNFYVLSDGAMPHAAMFFLITSFVWYSIRFYENPDWKTSLLMGLAGGLIVLARPNHILIWSIPLFYGWLSPGGFRSQIAFFKKHFLLILWWPLCLFIIYLPQLIYWKHTTGSWFYYSYGQEGFFWTHPRVMDTLFSYRKGWLVYTPVMISAIAGIIFLLKKIPELSVSVLVLLLFNIWALSSWWCWWYGGSFGSRPFIDIYGPLALSMAALFTWTLQKIPYAKITGALILFFFIFMNNFQSIQYSRGVLHFDSMTKVAYWKTFLQIDKPDDFETSLKHPDYGKALKGENEYDR